MKFHVNKDTFSNSGGHFYPLYATCPKFVNTAACWSSHREGVGRRRAILLCLAHLLSGLAGLALWRGRHEAMMDGQFTLHHNEITLNVLLSTF